MTIYRKLINLKPLLNIYTSRYLYGDNLVKTTITLKDDLYKKLVKEAVDRYGRTRNLSRLINEKLEGSEISELNTGTKTMSRKERGDIVERSFGILKLKETGAEYARKMRKGWGKRAKRLGI